MKLFLVHIANLAVVMHLTFGCNWHHGMNSIHKCSANDVSVSECCSAEIESEPACCDHESDEPQQSEKQPSSIVCVVDEIHHESSNEHCHHGCTDDGCDFNTVVRLEFCPIDFSTAYICGHDCLAVQSFRLSLGFESPPDNSFCALKLRPHLFLGVQLL